MFTSKKIIAAIVLLCSTLSLNAQFVNYGTDPAGYKWNVVNTDRYKIIYPAGNDTMAYRYLQLLETTYPHVQRTIGTSRAWKFPVVLHPGNMLSNGMVAWAPRRMELLTTPSSDNSAQMWDSHLVLHESRHIFQTRKFMHGIFYPLYFLFGEQISGISNFGIPTWFLEGDAVAAETALSNTGRGRLPEFSMIYRAAQVEEGPFYKFDKWFLGSYKDYTGSKYALGYNMTAYARYTHGADIWDKVTTRYIRRILSIPPFTNAYKHHSGESKQQLFENTFSFLGEEWSRLEEEHIRSGFRPQYLSPGSKYYTAYQYPQSINDSTVVALKSGLSDLSSLVMLTGGEEKRLTYVGSINSKIIHANGRIFWCENVSGLRWTHQNHSVLKFYDLQSGKTHTVTPKQRYQSPAVNDAGTMAAVSEFSVDGHNRIILVDVETGQETAHFDTPDNSFAKDITFADNNQLYVTTVGHSGISIWSLNPTNNHWQEVFSPTWANINSTFWNNGNLIFESGLNGTNNIYSLNTQTGTSQRLTTARFGAFTPALSADKNKLLFADFQKSGYRLASVSVDSLTRENANFDTPYKFALAETLSEQEGFNADTVQLKEIEFKPKRYRKALNLLKIHSWSPFFYDANDLINMDIDDFSTIVKPGAMVLSQNHLNTATTQLGWYYSDGSHHGKLAFTYTGWYPVIDLNVTYGGKAFDAGWVKDEEGEKESLRSGYTDRNLLEAEARIYIPFNLSRNHYTRGIQPSITYYFTNNRFQQHTNRKFSYFQYLLPELRFYNYRRMAVRDILPRLGYQLRLHNLTTLGTGDLYGRLYGARLTGYLPGLFANNSLMLRAGYQYQELDNKIMYAPKRIMSAPRGYNYNYATHQLFEFKADYAFPIAYPDWSLGSIAYIKRLRGNAFFDLSTNQISNQGDWYTQKSVGLDFMFDWNGLQAEFPLTTGIRLIKPFDDGKGLAAELLFSISF